MNKYFNLLIFIFIFIFFSKECQAYIDPGTGSFILQIIIGGILGFLFMFKTYFKRIKRFFLKILHKKNIDDK
jgi:hypothetical protein